jgi:hypothetical protein
MFDRDFKYLFNSYRMISEATWRLYHFCGLKSAFRKMRRDAFYFNDDPGEEDDAANMGYKGSISTSRIPRGGYNWDMRGGGVIFELDGRHISQRYKIKPVSLMSGEYGQELVKKNIISARHMDENEDRIFSNEESMPIVGNVDKINILNKAVLDHLNGIDVQEQGMVEDLTMVKEIVDRARKHSIPVYLYGDEKAFGHLDERKARKLDRVEINIK